MSAINIISNDKEYINRFRVKGEEFPEAIKVVFPILKPWAFSNVLVSDDIIEFERLSDDEDGDNFLWQASFNSPHLTHKQFVFICTLPETAICNQLNTTNAEHELKRWYKYIRSVIDFTLQYRTVCHIIMLDNLDLIDSAINEINEKVGIQIHLIPNKPLSNYKKNIANILSPVLSREKSINSIVLELTALCSINSISDARNDFSIMMNSISNILKFEGTYLSNQQKLTTVEHQYLLEKNELISESDIARLQILQLQEELASLNLQIKEQLLLKQKLNESSDTNNKLVKEINTVRSENDIAILQISQLQKELEFHILSTQDHEKIKRQLSEVKEANKIVNKETINLRSENNNLKIQITKLNELINDATTSKESLNIQLKTLEIQSNALKKQLENMNSELENNIKIDKAHVREMAVDNLSLQIIENYLDH